MTPATDAAREARAREVLHRQGVRISQTMLNDGVIRAMLAFADTEAASQPREGDAVAALREIAASDGIGRAADIAIAALTQRPPEQAGAVPTRCDGKEQYAFEAWANDKLYVMDEHPLHYLFLDPRTAAARDGWAAGLAYAVEQMLSAAPTPPDAGSGSDGAGEMPLLSLMPRDLPVAIARCDISRGQTVTADMLKNVRATQPGDGGRS